MLLAKSYTYETATAGLKFESEFVAHLRGLHTINRRRGEASQVMCMIVEEADLSGWTIYLKVQPFGQPLHGSLDSSQLEEFYRKFGFEIVGTDFPVTMKREPNGGM